MAKTAKGTMEVGLNGGGTGPTVAVGVGPRVVNHIPLISLALEQNTTDQPMADHPH